MKSIWQSETILDKILDLWSLEDFRKFLDEGKLRPSDTEYDWYIQNTNCILMFFLHREVTARTKQMMKIILQDGADPMFKIQNGPTLASRALKKSDVEVATMFLDHLKDINAPLDDYETRAIHFITEYQDESLLPFVLSYNPDLDIKDIRGRTALHIAVLKRSHPKTRILVDAGVNVDIADEDGNTPIHCILGDKQGDESIAFLLLDVANVTCKNKFGNTPLHLIMEFHKPYFLQMLNILLDKGSDPWVPNMFGGTPLNNILGFRKKFPACYGLEVLKILFERGVLINGRDPFGNSILHMIAQFHNGYEPFHDFLILLLENGADPNLVNKRNETVIDKYKNTNHSRGLSVIKYLVLKSYENKFQFGPQLLSSIESDEKFAEFFNICKRVLSNFEHISFYSTKPFTLFDVLTATCTGVLVRYVKNKYLRETMASLDVDMYPAYVSDLRKKFEFGIEHCEAEMNAIQYLSCGGLMNLECMESIVKFLPIEELRRIMNS